MAGIYIHIPFCASRCIYCDFYSTTSLPLQDQYTEALCNEIRLRREYLSDTSCEQEPMTIDTIYFGGGTPSQLSHNNLHKIFNALDKYIFSDSRYLLSSNPEITLECNPDDITPDFTQSLRELPVNRISMGVQSFSDERLKFLRRRHSSQDVYRAIDLLKEVGIDNISIDLIFGFPNQTLEEWEYDLHKAIEMNIQHLSAYSLMYEEGTPLFHLLKTNKVQEIDEDLSLDMFNLLIDTLTDSGFEHYEISNFAKHGFRSRHNSSYWKNIAYLGLGASAHSYNGQSRQWNIADMKQYINAIRENNILAEVEYLDEDTKYNDLITTALRTKEGIDLCSLNDYYHDFLLQNAEKHIRKGTLMIADNRVSLTRKGLFTSDAIMEDLVKV